MSKEFLHGMQYEGCRQCVHNPKAEKPYDDMKHVDLDDSTFKFLDQVATENRLDINCVACASLCFLMDKPEQEVVKLLETILKRIIPQ